MRKLRQPMKLQSSIYWNNAEARTSTQSYYSVTNMSAEMAKASTLIHTYGTHAWADTYKSFQFTSPR